MKKFLSLLLALTMVMSLVVVPARADEKAPEVGGDLSITVPSSITKGDKAVQFTLTGTPTLANVENAADEQWTYIWNIGSSFTGEAGAGATTNGLTAAAATTTTGTTVSCTVRVTYKVDGVQKSVERPVTSASFQIADAILDSDISSVSFKGRGYSYASNTAAVLYDEAEASALEEAKNWGVNAAGVTVDSVSVSDGSVTLNLKKGDLTKSIMVTASKLNAPRITASPETGAKTGTKVTFTLNATTSANTRITWTYKADKVAEAPFFPTKGSAANTYEWILPSTLETKTYTITCALSESGAANTAVSGTTTVGVVKDENKLLYNPAITATRGSEVNLSLTFTDKDNNAIDGALSNVNWTVTPETAPKPTFSGNTVSLDKKTASNKLTIPSNATVSTYTVEATFTYGGKKYTATFTVNINALTAKLSYGVQNGGYTDLYTNTNAYNYTNTLIALAENAIRTQVTGKSNVRVTSATLAQISGTTRGTLSSLGVGGYRYTAPRSYIGADTLRITAHADDGITYTVTLTVPVTPILNTSFASVNAEQLNTSNTSYASYKVSFPATYARYYVVSAVNGAAPADWSTVQLGTAYSATSPYTLTLNNLNAASGQVTLYIVAQRSTLYGSDEYYGGTMTVYLKDYNINYNGVAGETVQFKHADFTNFMNEVAQARGDSSKTTSYPYVTFNSVSFSMPSTTQGTLYYNGTAMSNSNASGAFNSRTQITNLDAVTFVPNAKTNVKAITLNFTLSGTKYTNYSASRGTPVTYTGTVVINLVREDIKYTVAAGDAISFTNTDFLNYLRTQSGINFNYDIDYVTFDQSAVNVMNEGVLYNGYSGYSQVKTTDKFYYTATNYYTQNALSDVTFRASPSAKNGATVYIPFTIYAKLSSSSIASRQVTGTVAIKIAQTMNFVDVKPTDYFYNSVKWALTKNITKGTSATTFSPYKTCTRAEIVTFLWRDAGSPMPTISNNPFTDVSYNMGADFYYAILWASQNGITAGTTATKFSPYDNCTRAQIVTFLWRYAKKPAGYASNPFTDVNKTDHASYYDAILWAVSKGITTGSTAKTFSPNGTCTRGEAVTFLYRYNGGK